MPQLEVEFLVDFEFNLPAIALQPLSVAVGELPLFRTQTQPRNSTSEATSLK